MKILALTALAVGIAASIAVIVLQAIRLKRASAPSSLSVGILIGAALFLIIAVFNAVVLLRYSDYLFGA